MRTQKTQTYFFETNSNAAPFVSDRDSGFVKAENPVEALKEVIAKYRHSCGLYAAIIMEASPEQVPLARYLSARAATNADAPCGMTHWENDGLVVDSKKFPIKNARIEVRRGRRWVSLEARLQ